MNLKPVERRLLVVSAAILFVEIAGSQVKAPEDSIETSGQLTAHRLQFGLNTLGVGIEYRYHFVSFASADAVFSGWSPGAAVGLTLSPIPVLFVQGVYGTGTWEAEAVAADGPPLLKPDYLYGWKAGFQFPLAPRTSPVYLQFGGGQVTYVQRHYLYNVSGLIVPPPPAPLYRREVRKTEVFILSLGFSIR